MVIIAADAMTAEGGIEVIVNGAKKAVDSDENMNIILTGDEILLEQAIDSYDRIAIYPASQVIGMDEDPAKTMRKKPDASVSVSAQLVTDNKADMMLSAGNTGASIAAAYFKFPRNKIRSRPVAVVLPTKKKNKYTVLLDAGADKDFEPKFLVNYAIMGYEFSRHVLGVENPKVGLLNLGREKGKGPRYLVKLDDSMGKNEINYIGFVEGRDTRTGEIDVAVCNGLIGNILLKGMEESHRVDMVLLEMLCIGNEKRQEALETLKEDGLIDEFKKYHYESQGGGLVLGLEKPLVIGHGSSSEEAITSAFLFAKRCYDGDLQKMNEEIKRKISAAQYPIFLKQ